LGVHRQGLITGYLLTVAVAAFIAPVLVAIVPVFIPAALLMFIGLTMLTDWLVATARRLTLIDWLTVLIIVLATALIGILPAIGIGLALALLGFAYASIRLPIIRQSTTVAKRHSIRDRSVPHRDALLQQGDRICILHLQGPLFFGSVEKMISHLRQVTAQRPGMAWAILDFSEVYSFDSSACSALDKLSNLMAAQGVSAHLTGVSPGLRAVFAKWGLPMALTDGAPGFRLWPQLDEAIEHCENQLLDQLGLPSEQTDVAHILFDLGRQHPRTADLIARMQRLVLPKGEVLIKSADRSGDVFFVTSGRLGVHLPAALGGSMRVRVMGPGAIVGEIAYMSDRPRNADVVCEEATTVLCLTAASIRQIEEQDRDLAALMMSIFNRSLASKLDMTNGLLTYTTTMAAS
jgi:SulP family sulfate permease